MITKVRIKNFRSHLDSEFNFSGGTNALVGILGSGKSLPYYEKVLIKHRTWGKHKIGKIVERTLEKSKNMCQKDNIIFTNENPYNIFVQSFNPHTFKMEVKRVTRFIKHKSPPTLIQIRTRTGRRITVTKDHSLLVFRNGRFVPTRGLEIKKGDFIPSVRKLNLDSKIKKIVTSEILPDFRDTTHILRGLQIVDSGESFSRATEIVGISQPYTLENWSRRKVLPEPGLIISKHLRTAIPKRIELSNEFAKLCGAYISEGSSEYDEEESQYGLRVTNTDPSFMEEVEISWRKTFPHIPCKPTHNSLQMNGKVVAAFFRRLFGADAGSKEIPDFVYSFDEEKLSNFLMMYFDGDGWVVPKDELACSSKSLSLIDGLLTLLSKFGIMGTIRERMINGESYYDLNVLPKYIPTFAKHVKFLNKNKRIKLLKVSNIIKNRSKWDGIDIIPGIGKLLHSLILEYHLSSKKRPKIRSMANSFRMVYLGYQNMGRERLKRCLELIYNTFKHKTDSFKTLEKIVDGDIFFDKIVEINEIPFDSEYVYDLSVEGLENFVAGVGNVIVHNSTVMNALCFGLFGTFPDLQGKKVKLDDIIMNKPSVKDQAEVVVDFKVDGKTYTVMRVIERGKGTTYSEIREGDKLLDAPNTQRVTELIEKILKVNYELFSKAIYSEQNALDYFLRLPRGERMRRIDNLMTIDKFEQVRSSTVTLRNKLVERKLGKQSIIDQTDMKELNKDISDIEYSLEGLNNSKDKVSKDLQALTKEKTEIEKKLEKLDKLNKDLIYFKQEEKSLETAIEENEKVIGDIKQILKGKKPEKIKENLKKFSEKLEILEKNLTKKRSEYEKLTELISESKTRIELLEKEKIKRLDEEVSEKLEFQKKITDLKKEYGKPTEALKKEKKELEKIDKELASISAKFTEIQDILEQVHHLKDQCPVCLSKLTPAKKKKLIEQQKKKMKEIEERLKKMKKDREVKEESVQALEEVVDKFKQFLTEVTDLDKLQTELKESNKKHFELLKIVKANEKEFNEMKEEIAKLETSMDKSKDEKQSLEMIASRLSEFEKMKSRLSDFRSKEKEVKKKITDIVEKIGDQDLEKTRREFTNVTSRISELNERIKSLSNLITEKENRKKEHEEKLKLIETQKKDVVKLEKIIKDLRIFEKALERTQVQLRTEFIDAVNYTMSEIWPNLYPYEDFTGIALNIEAGDYVLQLKTRAGDWINADGVASGGERSLACLALRIAFSLVLAPQLGFLILDEPTANLDRSAITELANTLRERINEFVDQAFIISHTPELEDAVTGFAYRLERDKTTDDSTKIVKLN